MRKAYLFMMVSLDGFFEGPNHDLSWHNVDGEFNEYAIKQLDESGTLMLGRKTYELFAGFWHAALKDASTAEDDLVVARLLEAKEKIVFSRSLDRAGWNNTRLVKDDAYGEVARMKRQPGGDIAIFGSNNLCVNLMQKGLVDEFRIMVNPVVIGKGTPLFTGLGETFGLKLAKTKEFKSGNVLLYYQPAKKKNAKAMK